MLDGTRKFSLVDDKNAEMKRVLTTVYDALKEKGYNPINQIVGYLLRHAPVGSGGRRRHHVRHDSGQRHDLSPA